MANTRHDALAKVWAQWNGQKGTAKQIERIQKQLRVEDLTRMLAERGVCVMTEAEAKANGVALEAAKREMGFTGAVRMTGRPIMSIIADHLGRS